MVIEKSCNKILIGKTFWKGVALPSILMGNQVTNLNLTQVEKLQTIENGVYRKILGASGTVLETLRGNIGASLMESRIMENKILFAKNIIEGKNKLIKEILRNMREDEDNAKRINTEKEMRRNMRKGDDKEKKKKIVKVKGNKWMEQLDKYLEILNIEYGDIEEKDKKEIKRIIKEYDDNKWKAELESKPLARIYYEKKKEIKQEKIYDNRWSSVLLFRARANILDLNDRQRFNQGHKDTSCKLCGEEYEDLTHFLIKCKGLEEQRNTQIILKNKGSNDEVTVGNVLFDIEEQDLEKTKKMLQRMWNKRKKFEQNLRKDNGMEKKEKMKKRTLETMKIKKKLQKGKKGKGSLP